MWKTQATGWAVNFAANPLPTAFYGPQIPLSADSGNRVQLTDLKCIFAGEGAHFGG